MYLFPVICREQSCLDLLLELSTFAKDYFILRYLHFLDPLWLVFCGFPFKTPLDDANSMSLTYCVLNLSYHILVLSCDFLELLTKRSNDLPHMS